MKRRKAFKEGNPKPLVTHDSRFGIRKIYLNPNETPKIATYSSVGRGPNGEHQN